MSGTIRSRMEAQRDRHDTNRWRMRPDGQYVCENCGHSWPCPDRVAADDTLTDLNNATKLMDVPNIGLPEVRVRVYSGYRLIPDREEPHGRRPDRVDG